MSCPYCNSESVNRLYEHPYPYDRFDRMNGDVQQIDKFECKCGYTFFHEFRNGVNQTYKQGMYQFRGQDDNSKTSKR